MTESVNPALDDAEREIRRLAQEAFDELVQRIRAGEVSRDVIAEIQQRFGDRFSGALASAFTDVLGRSISSGQVAALPIGQVSLSRRLYENSVEVSSQVRRVIERHAAGMRDARKLALDIFEGYGFKGGQDPLKVRAGLPKYLKELLADRELGAPLEQLYRRINASVVRTQPLKAAYLQAVDSVLDQFGGLRLEKALKVAQFERNRYFANRIAQTELHRAHTDRMAAEILADGELEAVQIVLSSTHPRTDICDMHARIDKYGLGPGCYPKALAPKPPFHPFCRCLLRKRFDLSATGARERGGAERAFLRDHPDPARVMGSRQKAADVLGGSAVADVLNAGRDPLYHLRTLGKPGGDADFFASAGRVPAMKISIDDRVAAQFGKRDGDARAYVLGNGRKTGFEYLYAYDAESGKVLATTTNRSATGVGMTGALRSAAEDRTRRIVVHHNHPDSTPPSAADIGAIGKFRGVTAAYIHGHDGSFYKISSVQPGNLLKALEAIATAGRTAAKFPECSTIPTDEFKFVIAAARLEALSASGVIRLQTNVLKSGDTYALVEKIAEAMVLAVLRVLGGQ